MDNYNSDIVFRIEEEDEDTKEQFTSVTTLKKSQNNIPRVKIEKVSPSRYGSHENSVNYIGETSDGTKVKVEVDLVNGQYFESIIEIEKNGLLQTSNYDSEEIRSSFVCDICKKSFSTKSKVGRHITRSHGERLLTRKSAEKKFVKDTFTADVSCATNEANQKPDMTKPLMFRCNFCQTSYSTKKQMSLHLKKSHENSTNKHSGRREPNNINGIKSTEGYTKISRPYKCVMCLKSFCRVGHLTAHHRVHTGEKPFECTVCLKSFYRKDLLTQHERMHTGEKPYKCTVCPKSYSQIGHLTAHHRVHTGEKPHRCDVCSKSFSITSLLTKHKRTHSGERPYKCPVCSNSFSRKHHLTAHQRKHTGEKPFECDVCLKSFSIESVLTKHKRTHSGERPYKCPVCPKSFAQLSTLTRHKRLHAGQK